MDGIFGVGIAELVVIAIVMLVVGGPRNTVKWAREAGRMMSQARQYLGRIMAEFEREMGEDGKEVMQTFRQVSSGVQEIKQSSRPTHLARQADKFIKEAVDTGKAASRPQGPAPREAAPAPSAPTQEKYAAWTPTTANSPLSEETPEQP